MNVINVRSASASVSVSVKFCLAQPYIQFRIGVYAIMCKQRKGVVKKTRRRYIRYYNKRRFNDLTREREREEGGVARSSKAHRKPSQARAGEVHTCVLDLVHVHIV